MNQNLFEFPDDFSFSFGFDDITNSLESYQNNAYKKKKSNEQISLSAPGTDYSHPQATDNDFAYIQPVDFSRKRTIEQITNNNIFIPKYKKQSKNILSVNPISRTIAPNRQLFKGSRIMSTEINVPVIVQDPDIIQKINKLEFALLQLSLTNGPVDSQKHKLEKVFLKTKELIENAKTEESIGNIIDKVLVKNFPFLSLRFISSDPKKPNVHVKKNKTETVSTETQYNIENAFPRTEREYIKKPVNTLFDVNNSPKRSNNIFIQKENKMINLSEPSLTIPQSKATYKVQSDFIKPQNKYMFGRTNFKYHQKSQVKKITNTIGFYQPLFENSSINNSIITLKFNFLKKINNRSTQMLRLHRVLLALRKMVISDVSQKMLVENSFLELKYDLEENGLNQQIVDDIIAKRIKSSKSFPFFSYLYTFHYDGPIDKFHSNENKVLADSSEKYSEPVSLNSDNTVKTHSTDTPVRTESLQPIYNKQQISLNINKIFNDFNSRQNPFYWNSTIQ